MIAASVAQENRRPQKKACDLPQGRLGARQKTSDGFLACPFVVLNLASDPVKASRAKWSGCDARQLLRLPDLDRAPSPEARWNWTTSIDRESEGQRVCIQIFQPWDTNVSVLDFTCESDSG